MSWDGLDKYNTTVEHLLSGLNMCELDCTGGAQLPMFQDFVELGCMNVVTTFPVSTVKPRYIECLDNPHFSIWLSSAPLYNDVSTRKPLEV